MTKIRIYNFRKLANKVLSHRKQMTMRKVRKRQSKEGELMHPYIVYFPGEATIKKLKRKKLKDITLKDAIADGFNSIEECQKTITQMHDCNLDEEFDLTPFQPHWEPLLIVNLVQLRLVRETLKKIQWDKNLARVLETEIVNCLNLVNEMINCDDPKVDMRRGKSLEEFLKDDNSIL